ncbi:MAG: ROK family protein [Coprobacillaceae bacterium]
MDEYLRGIYTDIFYRWILNYSNDDFTVSVDENDKGILLIQTQTSESQIIFNPYNIIEFRITNLISQEVEFYLHFQMRTLQHAIELFNEMLESINDISKNYILKVLLCCSSGFTTTYFASQLQEAANLMNLHIQIDATSYQHLYKRAEEYDFILLAPQIAYKYTELKKAFSQKKILKISTKVFAQSDVRTMINIILENQKKHNRSITDKVFDNIPTIRAKMLCVSFFRNNNRIHISYRIYDNSEVIEENTIIKGAMSINDIYDTIDTIIVRYPALEILGISIPGIINDGHLSSINILGLEDCDLQLLLTKRYQKKVLLSNDVNTVAVGYHAVQQKYSSLAFLFQPVDSYSGIGTIINNELVIGRKSLAGESQFLPLNLSDDFINLTTTPKGALEVVSKTILSIMSIISPDAIIIYCDMLASSEELIQELSEHISEKYIPDIIMVNDMHEYILHGVMILCSREYRRTLVE